MVRIAPLFNSYPNNYYETPNCHQNIEIIALNIQGMNSMGLSAPLYISYPNNYYETPNDTKTLRLFPWKIGRD